MAAEVLRRCQVGRELDDLLRSPGTGRVPFPESFREGVEYRLSLAAPQADFDSRFGEYIQEFKNNRFDRSTAGFKKLFYRLVIAAEVVGDAARVIEWIQKQRPGTRLPVTYQRGKDFWTTEVVLGNAP